MLLLVFKNAFLFFINFIFPGISSLYQGRYRSFAIYTGLPVAFIFFVSWTHLIFTPFGLFWIPFGLVLINGVFAGLAVLNYFSLLSPPKIVSRFFLCLLWYGFWYGTLFLVFLYKSFILGFDIYQVSSNSMEPTLYPHEYVLADTYPEKYAQGNIVFFHRKETGGRVYVKRIFAINNPGNLEKTQESISIYDQKFGAIVISKNQVYLVGDNYTASYDSRSFGSIPVFAIQAKAILVYRNKQWINLY